MISSWLAASPRWRFGLTCSLRWRVGLTGRGGRFLLGMVLVLGMVAGCGPRSSLPKTYPVTGSVAYKGGQPVKTGTIQFAPVNDSTFSVTGEIQSDGTFTLSMLKGNEKSKGAPKGEYRVSIIVPNPARERAVLDIPLDKPIRVEPRENHFKIEVDPPRR